MSKLTVLIADAVSKQCDQVLADRGIEVIRAVGVDRKELLGHIAEADGMIVRSGVQVDADMIAAARRMQAIGRAGTGVDNIDVPAATERGILVINVPGGNSLSVAEHTMGLVLAVLRKIPAANASLRRGEWDRKSFSGAELSGRRCGILGLGRIGREVAERMAAFGVEVCAHDPVLSSEAIRALGVAPVSFEELISESDILTIHIPMTPETKGLIGSEQIGRMKHGVVIVNSARGGIVEEGALLDGLNDGRVAGAALDVFESEPPMFPSPLVEHPNVVATPHIAASTVEAQERIAVAIAEQMADLLEGRGATGVVNAAELEGAFGSDALPMMRAAERLGSALGQLVGNSGVSCTLTAYGTEASSIVRGLGAAYLSGMLSLGLDTSVNAINATMLAEANNVIVQTSGAGPHPYYNTLMVAEATSARQSRSAAMTVYGTGEARLVMLDGVWLDARPSGTMILFENRDQPGVLAEVSNVLARHTVNIADVTLGRIEGTGRALTIMRVDGEIREAALNDLSRLEVISGVRTLSFPEGEEYHG